MAEVDSNSGCHYHYICFTGTKTVWLKFYIKTQEKQLSQDIAYNDYNLGGQLIKFKVGLYNNSKYSFSKCTAMCSYKTISHLSEVCLFVFFAKHSIRPTATNTNQQWYSLQLTCIQGMRAYDKQKSIL